MTHTLNMHQNILRPQGRVTKKSPRVKIIMIAAIACAALFGILYRPAPALATVGAVCTTTPDCGDPNQACSAITHTCAIASSIGTTTENADTSSVCKPWYNIGCWVALGAGGILASFALAINTLMGLLFGVVIMIEAWLIGVILQINESVVNTVVVQSGFGVTLSLANLGFVLGIIVIALSTILHRQTYGIKQILWKLVVAALLVNFGLSIAGVFISFANTLTNYFMAGFPGQGGGFVGFATNIAAVFQPQQYLGTGSTGVAPDAAATSVLQNMAGGFGAALGSLLPAIASVLMAAIGLVTIVIVLGTLIVMLLIRYVYLALLLVLMPLAWVSWVFPLLRQHWSKWWSTFLRWTFFPPLVVFFIWLVLKTGNAIQNSASDPLSPFYQVDTSFSSTSSNPIMGAISNFFGNILTPVIKTTVNDVLLIGLLIGGLFAANSMSIKFAGAGMKAFGAARGAILGYYGKQGVKAGRATVRKINEKTGIIDRMRGSRVRPIAVVGRAIHGTTTNEAYVEQAKRKLPDNPEDIKKNMLGSMNKEMIFASLDKLVKTGDLKKTDMVGNQTVGEWKDTHQKDVGGYNQGKLSKNVDTAIGSDKDMRSADKVMDDAEKHGKDPMTEEMQDATGKTVKAFDALNEATRKFMEKLEKGDVAKMNVNEIFSPEASQRVAKAIARQLALASPQLVPGMLHKMKSPTLKNFSTTYRSQIEKELDALAKNTTMASGEKEEQLKRLAFASDAFEKAFANNAFGFSGGDKEGEPSSGAPPAAPPSSAPKP